MRRLLLILSGLASVGVLPFAQAEDRAAPRVVAAWAAGPFEARVVFDRAISEEAAKALVGRSIAFRRGDESGTLRIAAAKRADEGRTLVVTTDPHPRAATYTFEIPIGPGGPVKVEYDLSGVEVSWTDEDGAVGWKGWWPSLDPVRARKALADSPEQARGFALLGGKGKLTLETLVTLPKGSDTLTIAAPAAIEATLNGEAPKLDDHLEKFQVARFPVESTGDPLFLSLSLPTGAAPLQVTAHKSKGREASPDIHRRHLTLPWAPPLPPPAPPLQNVPDLTGGDPKRGAVVFAGAEAKCSQCHKVRGEGGNVGPDLSNQVGRDRKEVYRDIAEPSARIHPDFVPYTIALKDGRVLTGTVRAEGADAIRLADAEAKVATIPRADIEEFRPASASVMPVGLPGVIGEEKLRDLIAFLTTAPGR